VKCSEVHDHFRGIEIGVDWRHTTDGFKAGEPDTEVEALAVAWKPSQEALRTAHGLGARLFIAHESLCVQSPNDDPRGEKASALPSEQPMFEWLEQTGMVVYRCHDVWDRYPRDGVRWAWQNGLSLEGEIIADEYPVLVTEIAPTTVGRLAQLILDRAIPLGQNGVLVNGDLNRPICRVGTGTGAATNPLLMRELGADVGIVVDDYYTYVRMGVHTHDLNFPTIGVNHGVAEEWGIRNLATHLEEAFPGVQVHYIAEQCVYTILT